MLEYIFFEESLRDKFVAYAKEQGVAVETSDDEGLVAMVPEDLDDEMSDKIDHQYEVLLQENAELLQDTDDALMINNAGVQVQLADGSPCMIRLDPDLMSRMLSCISMEELRDVVQAIAENLESPDNRPLCHT